MPKSIFTKDYERFRETLIKARKDARLTQTQVAKRLGKPQSFVSKYESGERRLDIVEFMTICKKLGVSAKAVIERLESEKD